MAQEAAEFGLFFLFVALNLVWFALRNIAIAVDEYVLFEALETTRRAGYFRRPRRAFLRSADDLACLSR